jgi:hypothetical protein
METTWTIRAHSMICMAFTRGQLECSSADSERLTVSYPPYKNTMEDSIESILAEIQERLPAVSTWSYIAMWAIADMMQRAEKSPAAPRFEDVLFPHTGIPLFTKEQARQLEEVWPWKGQTGGSHVGGHVGGGFPQSLSELSKSPKLIGHALDAAFNNPELLSIDDKFKSITKSLDEWDDVITDASKQYGLMALESVAPDPKFVIPFVPPIPVVIPARLVLPTLNAILELVRIATSLIPPIEILGKPVTLVMVFLDLARGNLYHAIFSILGLLGKYPMYAGIGMKILRDAYVLISPDIRSELRSVLYKSGKSMTVGWIIWLFAIVAPDIVRKPIVNLLDKVRTLVENYNDMATKAEVKATAALKGFGSVEIPKMPSSHIPTIGDLYILQEYIHNPNIYCHPDVAPLLEELRSIPPMALFLDLFNIPKKGSPEYETACANVVAVPLVQQLAPKITLGPQLSQVS